MTAVPPTDPTRPELQGVRVWVDGRRGTPADAGVGVGALDHGVTVGDGVFETAKVVDGVPFALDRHHDRMDRSLAGIGLDPLDRDRMNAGIQAVLDQGGMRFGRLRCTVTAGVGPLGSDRLPGAATYVVSAMEVEQPGPSTTVAVVPWTRNERSALTGVKSTSYADNVVALAAAKGRGHTEALLANTAGMLCEGTGSNVFVVVDGTVRTPSLESGPLAGITRALTIEWLRAEGVEVVEEQLPLSVLSRADEVWITSSTRDIVAVTRLDVIPPVTLLNGVELAVPDLEPRDLAHGPVARQAQEIFARRSTEHTNP